MKKNIQAFTLMEIMFGILIFSVIATFYINFVQTGKRELHFTSEHFNALLVSQKLSEDISQEIQTNPYGFETLGIESSTISNFGIVDGNSIFFSFLHDTKAPWFNIDPAIDGKIGSDIQPLYSQFRNTTFSLKGQKVSTGISRAEVSINWKNAIGKGNYDIACLFPSSSVLKQVDLELKYNQADMEKETAIVFYNETEKTLSQLVAEKGGNYDTIKKLGVVHGICKSYFNSSFFTQTMAEIKDLENKRKIAASNPNAELASICESLGRGFYEIAKSSFQLICALQPIMDEIKSNFNVSHFGSQLWYYKNRLQGVLLEYKQLHSNFNSALYWSKINCENLLQSDISRNIGTKRQYRHILRLIDINKIFAVHPDFPSGKAEFKAFAENIRKICDGRNPSMTRYLKQETSWIDNQSVLFNKYPTLGKVHELLVRLKSTDDFINSSL
ncbi:MAG: hypothetical protein HQM10_09300 [Candidatus Riflebacteria bacterium]|nr:hypothetical protein [Candidatus Riflebacteria bacterium]